MFKQVLLLAANSLCFAAASRSYNTRSEYHRPSSGYGSHHSNGPLNFGNDPVPSSGPLKTLFSWKQLDFVFPDDKMRQALIQNKNYIPKNVMILDVDVYDDGNGLKVFVTLPRVRPGVPVTLAAVSHEKHDNANLLVPYPDWRTHAALFFKDCDNTITSAFRIHVDECGRLWVLDTGNNDAFAGVTSRIVCPPKVLIYDLRNNNRLIGKYTIPSSMIADTSLLVTIAVDNRRRDCSDSFAYIADALGYKMIVFDFRSKKYWRINSIQFFPYPDKSRFTINGESFDLMGGVFGLALGPLYRGNRRLYFHSIDSVRQSWVDTADLRNYTIWQNNMNGKARAFNMFNGTRSSQSAAAAMNYQGIMFFGLIASNEIGCWNSQTRFGKKNINIIAKDDETLQFLSGIKIYKDKLYVATCRLQKYMNYNVNENEENYRVLVGDLASMTRGTKCEVNFLNNRFDSEYEPDSESIDVPENNEFVFSPE